MSARARPFVLIIGPPAAGKMTVGQHVSALTGFPFSHNHQVIDSVIGIFPFGSPPFGRLVADLRSRIFQEVAVSDHSGFLYSLVWDFNSESGTSTVYDWVRSFRERGWRIVLVELRATLDVRLARNRTPHRLEHKPIKRDLDMSESILMRNEREWRMSTLPEDDLSLFDEHYIFENSERPAAELAAEIVSTIARSDE